MKINGISHRVLLALCFVCFSSLGQPAKVEVKKVDGQHQIWVNGERFQLRGVGLAHSEPERYAALAAAGGNSFRTWDTEHADYELAQAQKNGLMVAMGIEIEKELHGFDYNDESAVAAQFEKAKAIVDKYKDHPNLLFWIVGNELNLLFNEDGSLKAVNPKAYQAASDLIDYIHKVDPNHPVTYTFAGASAEQIRTAMQYTPQVDIISVQVYGGLGGISQAVKDIGIDKPFMVTEYGPMGHWEMPATTWGREIEEPSGTKAAGMASRMEQGLLDDDSGLIIGGYAFLWGQKQERTPTWYGMFNQSGEANARVDELTRIWTGDYPANRAPWVTEIRLNQRHATESIVVAPGQTLTVDVDVVDPDGDDLRFEWVLQQEVDIRSEGGAFEKEPESLPITMLESLPKGLKFSAPTQAGEYRIFAYIYDDKGKVGNANVPFMVVKK